MGEALDTLHPIDQKLLHPQHFTESLIQQAVICHLLSENEVSAIQSDLLKLLAEQCDSWSHGESSSVPIETAQQIMTSILFVISINLKSCQSPEQAVTRLKSEPLKLLFEDGLQIVREKINAARRLQKRIVNHLLETPNVYYRSTIADGINGFFKLYRPQFMAHELHITVDYPVLAGRPKLDGIEFIEQYLLYIQAENAFCIQFHSQEMHHLLCGLTEDYRSIPMNLFEFVLFSAIGLVLLHRSPQHLTLCPEDINELYSIFSGKSDKEISRCLEKAVFALDRHEMLPKSTKQYVLLTLQKLTYTIHHAVKRNTLDKIFLVPRYPEQKIQVSFTYEERMDDKKYRELVEKILQADTSEEKVFLILQEVHSLADLLDILSDTELQKEEYEYFIHKLPLSVFVILLSQYPNDDFLERESEQLLFEALLKRKQSLSPEEKQQVEQALDAIEK